MRKTHIIALAMIAAAGAGGCALIDQGRFLAAEGAARAVLVECSLAITERTKNLQAINGWLAGEGHEARAVALDCNGDGKSDL